MMTYLTTHSHLFHYHWQHLPTAGSGGHSDPPVCSSLVLACRDQGVCRVHYVPTEYHLVGGQMALGRCTLSEESDPLVSHTHHGTRCTKKVKQPFYTFTLALERLQAWNVWSENMPRYIPKTNFQNNPLVFFIVLLDSLQYFSKFALMLPWAILLDFANLSFYHERLRLHFQAGTVLLFGTELPITWWYPC